MNFVFLSPHFPANYWNFCDRLKANSVNVLAIGDTSYDQLDERLKNSLTEYYKVNSLDDYDQVFRGVAYLSFRHGKIDWLASLNEHWLDLEARLRDDFHITTDLGEKEIVHFRSRSAMRRAWKDLGLAMAPWAPISTMPELEAFGDKVSFPLIAKSDTIIDDVHSYRLRRPSLENFYNSLTADHRYIVEKFITGEVHTYDCIIDADGKPIYEASSVWPVPPLDLMERRLDILLYVPPAVAPELAALGQRVVNSLGLTSRFISVRFFKPGVEIPGIARADEYVIFDVVLRPSGGYTLDVMNFAHSTDVYKIWADMITNGTAEYASVEQPTYAVYYGRRDGHRYKHSIDEIKSKYWDRVTLTGAMPEVHNTLYGNEFVVARLKTKDEIGEFARFLNERELD